MLFLNSNFQNYDVELKKCWKNIFQNKLSIYSKNNNNTFGMPHILSLDIVEFTYNLMRHRNNYNLMRHRLMTYGLCHQSHIFFFHGCINISSEIYKY